MGTPKIDMYGLIEKQLIIINMNKTTKKKKYLQICRILDEINRQGNFCDIKIENGITTCVKSRESHSKIPDNTLCCTGCSNLTKNGCKAKSISCKLSYCYFGCGPRYCGLVETEKQEVLVERRGKVREIIIQYASKHRIPIFEIRASMRSQFKLSDKTGKIDCDISELRGLYNWDSARFINNKTK
jgi:hypothetical protein